METKIIRIDEKISGLIAESLGDKFVATGNKLMDRNRLVEEVRKTEQCFKYLYGFSASAVAIISIVSLLRFFGVFPTAGEGNTLILLFGVVGVVAASYQYKVKLEKLKTVVYLLDLKVEMEKGKN